MGRTVTVAEALRKFATVAGAARACVRGWRARQKIVVIESDDWGSVRTSSRKAYDRLAAGGWAMDRGQYNLDALETEEDLDLLQAVLEGVRDGRGRPACLTANMVVANPDFDRIRASGFREYFFEPVRDTLARSPERRGTAERWRRGLRRRLFVPQLHGREHVRWWEWLAALRDGSVEATTTFDLGMCGVAIASSREGRGFYGPTHLDEARLAREGIDLETVVREGARMFREQFGYRSASTIAPNYHWTDRVEQLWADEGVRYIQGRVLQIHDTPAGPARRYHFLGERGCAGGWYLVRNCVFEPAAQRGDCVGRCLRSIAAAFHWRKPAVVCTHRVNFIGSIDPRNRAEGLRELRRLLEAILLRWPDARFLSSVELGAMIERNLRRVEDLPDEVLPGREGDPS